MRSTILLPVILFSSGLYAQSDQQAIQQWQSLHPRTLLVSSERFQQLSTDELQLLGDDYILFHGTVSLEQLQQYDATAVNVVAGDQSMPEKENAKQWLADHPDIVLIAQSDFRAMDEAKQQECITNPAILVLQGETLSAEDLYDYEH